MSTPSDLAFVQESTPTKPTQGRGFSRIHPVLWVPSLYFAMGIPFNIIIGGTASRMYKSLGYSDSTITVALGSIGVAWSLKPLWAAFLDMYRTKKFFVLSMEFLIAGLLAGVAMSLPAHEFFRISVALFWVGAFASSTQDICADGIYLTALSKPDQSKFAGMQGTFWVLGKVFATGILISLLDRLKVSHHWTEQGLWQMVMLACAGTMGILVAYHFFSLPLGSVSQRPESAKKVMSDFVETAVSFFHKRMFWGMIAFVFLYRIGEGLIMMEGQLFLQSAVAQGGLGLTAGQVSSIDAIWGTIFSIIGGILGGVFISRIGLAKSLLILAVCLNVPHLTYVYLSQAAAAGHGVSYFTIATMVSIEKFGYGFGFVGNMIYMMQQLAPGRCTMTHYAFATALMNLVLVPTNMISGPLAEWLGFSTFFLVVMIASVPSILAAWKAPFPLDAKGTKSLNVEDASEQNTLTVDDPSLLSPGQRTVQVTAGRASIYAMLNILAILLIDTRILGSLADKISTSKNVFFGLLILNGGLKLFLSLRAFRHIRAAAVHASEWGESVYVANARGARWATFICAGVSIGVLALGIQLSRG